MIKDYNTLRWYSIKDNRQYDNTENISVLHHFLTNKIPSFQLIVDTVVSTATYKLYDINDTQISSGSAVVENDINEAGTAYSRLIFLGATLVGKDDGFYYMTMTYTDDGTYSDYTALSQTSRRWYGMTVAPNGNAYATVRDGDIYMQTAGAGDFIALSQTVRDWRHITAAPNGNIYATVSGGDIYMQTGGAGSFVALSQTAREWYGITSVSNGNVYASVNTGDIYMQTGGVGNFIALSQTSRLWRGMTAANGNVYACTTVGDIYMQTGESGNFVALSQDERLWYGMSATSNGDVYAVVFGGNTYVQRGGTGDFVSMDDQTELWNDIAVDNDDNIYSCVDNGDIYEKILSGAIGDVTQYSDVFCWQTDLSNYLKIVATTSNMMIGEFELNMTGFTYEVYLEAFNAAEEYEIEEEGVEKTYGAITLFNSRNHLNEFDITGYRATDSFLSGLRTVQSNGEITLTFDGNEFGIYDIEPTDKKSSSNYDDIIILGFKFKRDDYLQTKNTI